MTRSEIEEIRVRALRKLERDGMTAAFAGRCCAALRGDERRSAEGIKKYLRGDPSRQTAGHARAVLAAFPEIGYEKLVLHAEPDGNVRAN